MPVLEDFPDVPPAVMLLFVEVLAKAKDLTDGRRRLKDLLPDLKVQSEVYEAMCKVRQRPTPKPGVLEIFLDGGLNLLDRNSKAGCLDFRCRIEAAKRLARSIGLTADTIWLTDFMTEKFCIFGRVTNKKLLDTLEDLMVLEVFLPFILAGIVKFRTPWVPVCPSCLDDFEIGVDGITDQLFDQFSAQFSLDALPGVDAFAMQTGDAFSPSIVVRVMPGKGRLNWPPMHHEFSRSILRDSIHSTLWVAREAALGGGAVFSNSKIGLAGLSICEGRVRNRSELQLLDDHRSVNLPWVSDLSVLQIVQLRREASKALPLFRETMASRLAGSANPSSSSSSKEFIDNLREQAVDVRNELTVTQGHAKRLWNTPYTLLAFGISAYGLSTDQPATAALGGLLSLLQLVMSHKAGAEKEIDKLQRRPGYVMVKAQDILAHAR